MTIVSQGSKIRTPLKDRDGTITSYRYCYEYLIFNDSSFFLMSLYDRSLPVVIHHTYIKLINM